MFAEERAQQALQELKETYGKNRSHMTVAAKR
jgi:hypothetical protein